MLESCYRRLERCFGGAGGGDGLLWHMDLKPHASGDYSIAVVQANSSLEDQGQVFTSPSATYVGVYDGHGGPEAARFITNHLFPHLQRFASEQGGVSAEVIRKAFDATEEEFLHLVKQSWVDRPQIVSVGSCCLVGAISNGILYVANLGDSRAVLGHQVSHGRTTNSSTVVAERLSTDHNVGDEEVRKEVKALHPDDTHIVMYTRGVWRIKGIIQDPLHVRPIAHAIWDPHFGQLAVEAFTRGGALGPVSRSIGDVYLKKPEFNRDPLFRQYGAAVPLRRAVMSAEPSILIRKLRPQDLFLIFASDGLWEQLSDETAVGIVQKNPRVGIAKRLVRAAINEAAKKREMRYDDIKRIEKGVRRHFHDDITVVVLYLDQPPQGPLPVGNAKVKDHSIVDCTTAPLDIFSFNSDEADSSPHP